MRCRRLFVFLDVREETVARHLWIVSKLHRYPAEVLRRLGIIHDKDLLVRCKSFKVLVESQLEVSSRYAFILAFGSL